MNTATIDRPTTTEEPRTHRPEDDNGVLSFIHVRQYDHAGVVCGKGGMTIAYRQIEPGLIEYGMAFCSPKDNFDRRVGRIKATGRLNGTQRRHVTQCSLAEFRSFYHDVVLVD